MRAYRQWLNGVRRRAAVRSPLWRGVERAISAAVTPRLARAAAAVATATALGAAFGLVAKLNDARADAERGTQVSGPLPAAGPPAPESATQTAH